MGTGAGLSSSRVIASCSSRALSNATSAFSNSNLSYFVGLDADEAKSERLLSGDRNITGGALSTGFLHLLKTNTPAGWTAEMHKRAGNVVRVDGSVMQTIPEGLRQQLQKQTLRIIRLAIPITP